MRYVVLATTALVAFVFGCGPGGFHREAMDTPIADGPRQFDNHAVESIDGVKPQLRLPAHIAVSQPVTGKAWTREEIEEIASWESALRRAGIARELTVLPASMVSDCFRTSESRCALDGQREAAARIGAEALLVMNTATQVKTSTNVLAALDLTLVGMWLAPGHRLHATTVVEGTLMDNRNRYVYAFARGDGEEKATRPLMYAEQSGVENTSRHEAIVAFGDNFIAEAEQIELE